MPHNIAHRKLGRVSEHRLALLRNQATALLRHERIETTVPKAKELRPFVERLITLAKRGVAAGEAPKTLHARRLVSRDVQDVSVVSKLFEELAPRFAERPGGYTRILRLGYRRGDSAEVAQIELVGSEYNPAAEAETKDSEASKPKKSVGDRLKAAAQRIRGSKKDEDAKKSGKAHTKAEGGRKVTTPRKSGGS